MLLKYAGNGKHVRNISKKDFKSIGFEHDAISVDVREEAIVEVSDEVAEWLLSDESGEKADWTKPTDKEVQRYNVRNAPDTGDEPTTADTAKADKGVDAGAAAGGAVTTGGSNTAKGAGSSS